ncbi:hypothetical protein GCM10023322_17090 [Rugosimonospora acidiphila]|uniref:Actin-binding WH2 domain-containing protein n=1 Tax=Rugosimonospora acidiphila TaxID=556531 RepID=A0ABP9RMW5_9ACTN
MTGPSPGGGSLVIERILRDRDGIWRQIVEERGLRELIVRMLVSAGVSLALYGAVLGASLGWQQALSSLVKLPLLFLITLCICLPTLYLFNLVFGARLSVVQAVALIMVSVTVTSVLTLAFAPISLFFLVTAHGYAFFKLLNVAILMLTAIVGLRFLVQGMRALNEQQGLAASPAVAPVPLPAPVPAQVGANGRDAGGAGGVAAGGLPSGAEAGNDALAAAQATSGAPVPLVAKAPQPMVPPAGHGPIPPHPMAQPSGYGPFPSPQHRQPPANPQPQQASMGLLYIWILLFGFVGTQLGWTLRPFFGDPGQPFSLFRHLNGTFYADIVHTIGQLFGAG